MQISVPPIILVAVCLGAVAIGLGIVALIQSLVAARFQPAQKLSQVWTLAAALPSVVMVIMFYSLAIHVRLSLGQWPQSIGDVGFPSGLIMHERIAGNYVFGPLLVSLFIWPLAVFLCWWVSSWRRFIAYQTIHALSFLVGFGAICLAPSSFLNWWWD